ncbi:methylated-DNA--protein-cysteine methyltransferase-like [Bradysia coprophila]|uniref:methylated-DNA--protein-cysteine methyltransferase-like n=1 Tax=Bradysia coprophila TaxID=38358 RepID=UPI00187DA93D|nr:methylated-DNA--protein-cysteine methyltransferase-like [Bradysia coprophila]
MSGKKSREIVAKLTEALAEKKITKFQHNVYTQLLSVPLGKVTTYKEIAKAINCNSAQAIGQALQKNPFAPDVPCHRVIRSDLTLGGFSGSLTNETVDKKKNLLQKEGVQFVDTQDDLSSQAKVEKQSIWTFD